MGSGISNPSPESIEILLTQIASNKRFSYSDYEIARAALGGPTVLNLSLVDWLKYTSPPEPHNFTSPPEPLRVDSFVLPSISKIGQLAQIANNPEKFRGKLYKRKNGDLNLKLLNARYLIMQNPLMSTVDDILNVAAYSNLSKFGVYFAKGLVKKGLPTPSLPKVKSHPTASSPEKSHSKASSPEEYIVFHHYTSTDCIQAIKDTKKILRSTADGSTVYGCGVYGTPLCPENGRKKIAKNNYADGWRLKEKDGKVEAVFRIKIKKNQRVEIIVDGDRDIYLYNGDLEFEDAEEVDLIYFEGKTRKVQKLK